jgi:hypothetical protein
MHHGVMQIATIAVTGTSAATVAAAGGGWVAMGTEEYELLAEGLARKKAGEMGRGEERGGRCCDRRRSLGVMRMVQVNAITVEVAMERDEDDDGGAGGCCSGAGGCRRRRVRALARGGSGRQVRGGR